SVFYNFVAKMTDITVSGKLGLIFDGKWQSNLFIVEVLVSTIIPAALFFVPKYRGNNKVQWIGSSMVVIGMVLNRIDVGGLAMLDSTASYTPSWMEIAISLGVVSAAVLVFLFAIENFHVWDIRPEDPESLPHTLPSFDYSSRTWLGIPSVASLTKHTLAFVLSFALGMALMSGNRLHAEGIDQITVKPATVVDSLCDTLCINGNRDDQFVEFSHEGHISRIGKDSCRVCHHLSLPCLPMVIS
ncbi:MAG: hypothetical protein M1378_03515, partial [Bacteroidetes bacterium]|nr:hypothetical protein [Bacteroidota bacterium]